MRACAWFFVLAFVVGVIYPPSIAAIGCAATTAAVVVWLLVWMHSRTD